MNNKLHPQIAERKSDKIRQRGNYWEVTYKEDSPPFENWTLAKATDLAKDTGKTNVTVVSPLDSDTHAVNLYDKQFNVCDFNHFRLNDSTFKNCRFFDCRFVKSDFKNVKFSGCRFEACHFLNVTFQNCQFLACEFSNISASAVHLLFSDTGISAGAFVDALVTNVKALPNGITELYQNYRLLSDKVKLARGIFVSVRNEPELDLLFDANRCFELALRRRRIKEAHWSDINGQLVKRNVLYRFTVWPLRVAELWVTQAAGFLTDWGRSPMRSLLLVAATVVVFSGFYYLAFGQGLSISVLRALDCAFVFGYTKYSPNPSAQMRAIDWIMFVNTLAGFCWYALFIPALSKRLFR
jgi:Pentapeptide repeats (9 copies)